MADLSDPRALDAWQLADVVRADIWRLTAHPGFRQQLDLRTRLRRAAELACAHIAEGASAVEPGAFARALEAAEGALSDVIERVLAASHGGLIDLDDAARVSRLARRCRGACAQLLPGAEASAAPAPPTSF